MLTELLQSLKKSHRSKQKVATSAYIDLVRSVANGTTIKAAVAEPVLENSGKSVDKFEADIATMQQRVEARNRIDAIAGFAKKQSAIEKQINEANDIWEAAEIAHEKLTAPLHFQLDRIKKEFDETRRLNAMLTQTCLVESLVAEKTEVEHDRAAAVSQRDALSRDLKKWQASRDSAKESAEHHDKWGSGDANNHSDKIRETENLIARDEPKLKEANALVTKHESREIEIRELMLQP